MKQEQKNYTMKALVDHNNGILVTLLLNEQGRVMKKDTVHTQEEQTKKALVSLGWTPPGSAPQRPAQRTTGVTPEGEGVPAPLWFLLGVGFIAMGLAFLCRSEGWTWQ